MAIPEAAVPPFGPPINGEYEEAREAIAHSFDELYRSTQILATLATSTTGFATSQDIDALQVQINVINTTLTSLQSQISSLTVSLKFRVFTDATRPAAIASNANEPYVVKNPGKNARTEIILEGADGFFYQVPDASF